MSFGQYECIRCKAVFESRDPEPFCGSCIRILTGVDGKKTKLTRKAPPQSEDK